MSPNYIPQVTNSQSTEYDEEVNVTNGNTIDNPISGSSQSNVQSQQSEAITIVEPEPAKPVRRKAPAQETQRIEIERLERNELRLLKAKELGLLLSIDQVNELRKLKKTDTRSQK